MDDTECSGDVDSHMDFTSEDSPLHCYCGTKEVDVLSMIPCNGCKRYFHQDCFKTNRFSTLVGDRFISLDCESCGEKGEKVTRRPFTWPSAVCLTLYNLQMNGTHGKKGYFQWREQVCRFIEERWTQFFPDRKKAPKWQGAVACTLSTSAGVTFQSGINDVGEPGWWKLINNMPPDPNVAISQKPKKRRMPAGDLHPVEELGPRIRKKVLPDSVYQNYTIRDPKPKTEDTGTHAMNSNVEHSDAKPAPNEHNCEASNDSSMECPEDAESAAEETLVHPKEQALTVKALPIARLPPHDEEKLLQKLESFVASGSPMTPKQKRFLNKLRVRQMKRDRGLEVFDLDGECTRLTKQSINSDHEVLDRFVHTNVISTPMTFDSQEKFSVKLLGTNAAFTQIGFRSPYTHRDLKPFIFRDSHPDYPRIRLMKEICSHRLISECERTEYAVKSVDFVYVRPHHIAVVNSICRSFFWEGIDMSDQLNYPEFSIVALYGKIVIGFAFMAPLANCNDAYLSFLWTHPHFRRRGLARFMLYHLTQSCAGKDITLHVAATNPAVFLYQNFKFRIEKYCMNFYEKYLPGPSRECKHALFMRLKR
ncbi:cysteine-rich protein 2-binding protein [Galendromus occidentalis]|uniref:Cysteine-rich protein 2-binding protein n=1 Tax=Galendromus occidentalis TaxID=34638 RepID=A0AAJ6VVI0_9ACAR|nr:cysteine-rich protein 2-binding protein [Galendromus occidentalis]